jgi:hypothetical protein
MFDYFDDSYGFDDFAGFDDAFDFGGFDFGGDYEYFDDGSYNIYHSDGSVDTYDSDGSPYLEQDSGLPRSMDSGETPSDGDLDPGDQDDQDAGRDWNSVDQDMAPGSGGTSPTGGGTPPPAGGGGTPPPAGGGSPSTGGVINSALKAIKDYISGTNPVAAAGAGALLGSLMESGSLTGGSTPRREGFNMAEVGRIAPSQTNFGLGPARQVSYDQYGSQRAAPQYEANLLQDLSAPQAPVAMADGGAAYYTFGRAVNPMDNLNIAQQDGVQKMKSGGLPALSDVPVTGGRLDFRQGAAVHGPGDGQSDDIPAMLADGEYVIDAETVAQIGNGSTKAGSKALDDFRMNIRKHKRSAPLNKIPPKTKQLTSYLKKGD